MEREKTLRNLFLAAVAVLGFVLAWKMVPRIVLVRNVRMVLTKSREAVALLTDERKTDFTWRAYFSRIEFPEGESLSHPDRGDLGYSADFFLDFSVRMRVLREGYYLFGVASDDGFRLSFGTNLVGEFVSNRPFTTNRYRVYLKTGAYDYRLNYYQGFGRLGLAAFYQTPDASRPLPVGRNSRDVRFERE